MDQFFTRDYTGAPFELFGPAHLIALGIILAVNLSFLWLRRVQSPGLRRGVRISLAALLLIDEAAWHLWNAFTGQWTVQTMLPLHLCSVFVFLTAVMLLTRSYGIYEFAYLLGIAGALQALLTPDAGRYGFPHFRFFQVMLSHGAIITGALYMTLVEGYRPTRKSPLRVLVGANLYMVAVGLVNWILGSNYLFIAHKPETASLLDVLPPWPFYILWIELIGVVFVLLLYLPFWVIDRRAAANDHVAPV